MESIKKIARELLENKTVGIVIGYEQGTDGKPRPSFIVKPEGVDHLIYTDRCMVNLAVYLSRHEVRKVGRVGLIASLPIMKSVVVLAAENQIQDKDVFVIGVDQNGEYVELADFKAVEQYVNEHPVEYKPEEREMLDRIDAMSMEERWEFWKTELSKCFKCYACRSACPMCYCTKCTVECNQPQWIPTAAHELGNMEWHVMRAMHLGGRCVNCGECAHACPLSIPLNLLTLKMNEDIVKNFGFKAGHSLEDTYVLSTFKNEDNESFIR